ncbi:hypothetical protein Tco_0424955 [Tanacetum coccineum]
MRSYCLTDSHLYERNLWKSCGNGAHIGYNCPPKAPIISNPEQCNQTIDEFPQTLPSVHPTCNYEDENSFTYDSKPNSFNDSPSVLTHPPQPSMYSCEFYENDARYGHYCTPQVPFIYPEPCYNQDFKFPQDFHEFQQQYPCCEDYGDPHETFQCQPMNENYYHEQNSCYDSNSFGFDQTQPPQYTVNHPIFNAQNDFLNSQNKLMEQMTSICDMSKGISDGVCDVPLCDNPTPLEAFKEDSETIIDSNNDSTSSDDDYPYGEDIDYVDASPPDAEIVSLEVVESVIPEVRGIDTDIPLTIKDDILREKLLNVNLLIAKIEALKDDPVPSSDIMTKSSSTSLNLFLEETNTFDNSLTESETFRFNLEEISSGSTTTRSDYSLPDYEAFYLNDDHIEEKSSGSTTTHADFSQYDSFIFDLSINPFPPTDRSDFYHEEFADELAHIISPPEYDCFYFKNEPELGDFTMDVVGDIYPTREPRVHVPNVLPTHPTLDLDLDFILLSEPLFAYIVWIFLPFLTYPVAPPYLLFCGNEDTIFDPGIST